MTFNWHNSATSWNFLMRFSAKRFALAALSAYYNYTEIVKPLSFDLILEIKIAVERKVYLMLRAHRFVI